MTTWTARLSCSGKRLLSSPSGRFACEELFSSLPAATVVQVVMVVVKKEYQVVFKQLLKQ